MINEQNTLLEKLKKKDRQAVKDFIHQYNKKLYALVYNHTYNSHDAEEILQETWLKFFDSLPKFRSQSSLYTYIYRIAFNECLMWQRKNKIKFITGLFFEKKDLQTPETIALENEENVFLQKAVQALSAKQKKVFLLRTREELPFQEIARILQIKENNAKVHYFHALQNIRKYLKGSGIL